MKFDWKLALRNRLARKTFLRRISRRKGRRNQSLHTERLEERSLLSAISVIASDPFASEGESTGTFVFSRDNDFASSLNLNYSLSGTAMAGIDYAALAGTVTIPAGEASASVVVEPISDSTTEGSESVTVTLNTVAGHTLDLDTATVTIRDEFNGAGVGALVPISETFTMHSLPDARHRVYLDFNGGTISDNGTKTISAYNSDGSSGFSDAEKAEIQQIWSYIAEDLRPWQVDVTTEQPDIEQLRNTGGGDLEWGLRVTIGEDQSNLTAPGRSGVGIFDSSSDNNNWGVRQGSPEDTAGLLTHEIGHALGLNHDGAPGDDYYDGHGSGETAWGTYMGSAYQAIVQWDRGQYPGADNQEDDLNIIATTNGFAYRPDDHGNSVSTATGLVDLGNGVLLGEGIIERNTDLDLFSFTADSGPTRIFIDPPANSPNLDIKAELLDASLSVVATSDVTDQLAATFDQTLTAGSTYFVRVTGAGNRTWSTGGYDDYGSLGTYTVQVGGFATVASFVPGAGQDYDSIVGTSLFDDVTLSNLTKTGVSGGTNGAATWPLNWSGSASQDLTEYISFTATPDNGRVLDFNELSVNFGFVAANGTVAIRSSADGFGANIDGTRSLTGGTGTMTFDISSVADSNTATEFRVYLWSGGSGWRDLNSLSLNGRTIADAPLPPTAPVANNDSIGTDIDQAATIDVLANDTDANGDVLSVAQVSNLPSNGSIVINANNTITYTPNTGFDGTDSFTYIATDGGLNSNPATVTIDVSDTLPPPPPGTPAQFNVNHHPRLQLGDAPLDGYAGSDLDQIAILWQTQSAGSGTQDSFTVEYRLANSGNAWQSSGAISQINTGSGTRIVHEVEIDSLQWDTDYEYRVRHLRAGGLVEEWSDTFKTRLQAGDTTNFSFVAYGDSAKITSNTGFRSVQNRINQTDAEFAVLLGDNIYEDGTHGESDARFDPDLNPEAAVWMASHVDYLGLGNHDVRTGSGSPSENNFAVPVPTAGVDSPVAPPTSERPEHNFSWDYGDVHFVTFDTNAWNSSSRRDALLDYVIADLNASDARWKIVYGHHPIAAAPDKVSEWDSSTGRDYYDDVVSRFTTAGVDLFLTGHSHTFSWTHPLTGRDGSGNITHDHGDHDEFDTDVGLVQIISGLGGKNVRSGSHSSRMYVAAGWTADEAFVDGVVNPTSQRGEDGFAKIDVTQDTLTISYVAADDGAVIDSFTINQLEDTTGPTADLHSPLDGGASDLDPDAGEILVNQTQPAIDIHLHDFTDINDATVTASTVSITRDGNTLTAGSDYSFSYDTAADEITLTSLGGDFGDGVYNITLSGGAAHIADSLGNEMTSQTVGFEIDTTITPPVTVSFQDGVNGYTGTQDTSLRSSSPTTNNGSNVALEIDSSSVKHTLLRFDDIFGAGNGQIPTGATIQSATLEFTGFDPGDPPSLHRMLTSWSESSTYDELGNGVQADGVEAATTVDATFSGSTGSHSLNVTAALQAWLADPASNLGWAFLPSDSDGIDLHSSEASTIADRPKLSVTYVSGGQPANTEPVGVNDSATTNENTAVTIAVLANDTDADGDALTVASIATQPSDGAVVINANNTITYTPNAGYTGNDSFTYIANDGTDNSNAATVSITVNEVGNAITTSFQQGIEGYTGAVDTWIGSALPTADNSADDDLNLDESGGNDTEQTLLRFDEIFGNGDGQVPVDSTITSATLTLYVKNTGAAPELHRMLETWSDTDTWNSLGGGVQNDGVEASLVSDATFTHSSTTYEFKTVDVTASLQAWIANPASNNGWVFLPTGSDGLVFESSEDSDIEQRPALSVTYTASGANHAPVANADVRATNVNEAVTLRPDRNDFDTDGNALSAVIVTQPSNGTLISNGDGSFTYTPNAGFIGNDSFTYTANDGSLSSNTATVDLSVLALPTILPTPSNPFIPANDPVGEQQLLDEIAVRESTIAELVTAHPTANEIYGAIPVGTPRVTQAVTIDTIANASKTLHPTGLYAAPGELIYVTVPDELVAQGAQVHISTWTDDIDRRDTWLRVPDGVQREFDIDGTLTYAAGAFGGLIYIETPSNPPAGSFDVTIENAVEAPMFVLGETTDAQWNSGIRDLPAPWAVLRSGNLDIHLPSEHVRNLNNPTALMTFWKAVVDTQDDLSGVAETRTRPEGIAIDVQISIGYLHSGYPTKGAFDAAPELTDLATLQAEGAWGWFHELGHEHQQSRWNISGDTEVSVNFFTLYAYESLGLPSSRLTQEHRVTEASELLDVGNVYSDGGPWEKLAFYQQVQAGFGWDAFKTFFRSYYDGSLEDLNATFGTPSTNQEEIDHWLMRMSTITGRDLTPHFDAWGYGVTQAARDAVAHLPDWSMIENLTPTESVVSIGGAATTLDLNDNVWGAPLNGAITFTPAGTLTNGSLANNNDGTFTYTPNAGFLGTESLSFNVTNTQGGATSINVTFASATQSIADSPVDTRIGEDFADTDHSTSTTLYVDGVNGTFPAASLLKFDNLLGGGATQIPAGAQIVSAELELNFTDPGSSFTFHRMLQDWSDTDTFNSLTSGVSTNDVEAAATADFSTGSNAVGAKTFDVTAALAAWSADPNANFGWMLNPGTSSNGNDIASAESATPPELTVTWLPGTSTPPNSAPVAINDSATVNEDGAVTIAVLTNDSDPNGDAITPSVISNPSNGSVTVNANGTIGYTPNANYNGADSFTYRVSDGSLNSNTATVSLTVNAVNDAPVATNDGVYDTNPGVALVVPFATGVLANDDDVDGDTLTVSVVTGPSHGTVTLGTDGSFIYTADAGYVGADAFTYVANDGTTNSNAATVTIDVSVDPVTLTFKQDENGYTSTADTFVSGNNANTNYGSWNTLEIDLSSGTGHEHTLLRFDDIIGNGAGRIARDSVIQTATLEVYVTDFGNDPTLHRMLQSWTESSTFNSLGSGVQADGIEALATADATLDVTGSGSWHTVDVTTSLQAWTDDPSTNFGWAFLPSNTNGVEFTSSESGWAAPKLNVTFLPAAPNSSPVAGDDAASVNEDDSVTINVLTNDSDAEGHALTPTQLTQPANGTATLNANGTVTYTPNANFNGNDSFTYRVNDGELNSNTATVNVSVNAVNDAPTAVDDFFATDFESLLNIAPTSMIDNDSDIDGDALSVNSNTQPANGSVTVNADGSFSYAPDMDFVGNDTFAYTLSDGTSTSAATVTITVNAPADDHGEATNSTATAITLTGGDTGTGSASGTFEITGDRDMFRVSVGDGELSIDLDGINGLDTYLRVYDGAGTEIASNDDGGPDLSSVLTINVAPGTYYISAGSYSDSERGDYTLSVSHVADDHADVADSSASPITLNSGDRGIGSASGTFETAGDRDVFSVAVADGELTVDLNGISGLDTYLRVYDSAGTQIASNDDGGPGLSSALTIDVSAGTYYISAGSYNDGSTGDFTVDIAHRALVTNTFQQGIDGYTNSSDTFLSGDYPNQDFGGWTVNEIDLSSSGDHEHSLLQFADLFGSGTGQIPFGSEVTSATLTFYVSNGGDQITLHRMLTAWDDSTTWNSFTNGIQANDIEAMSTADAQSSSYLSTGWRNFDVTTSLIAWAADPSTNHGWALLPTGSNGVDFYSTNNVSYWVPRISIDYLAPNGDLHSDTPDASASVLDLSSGATTTFGTLEAAGDRDVFQFTVTQSTTITIDLGWTGAGSFVDTYLRLYDGAGTQIASNDDGGSGTSSFNSRLTITLGAGTYFVSAGSFADSDSGDFVINLSVAL